MSLIDVHLSLHVQDYDPVWEHYAYIYPVWVGDFGKNNMSASINMSETARVSLARAQFSAAGAAAGGFACGVDTDATVCIHMSETAQVRMCGWCAAAAAAAAARTLSCLIAAWMHVHVSLVLLCFRTM